MCTHFQGGKESFLFPSLYHVRIPFRSCKIILFWLSSLLFFLEDVSNKVTYVPEASSTCYFHFFFIPHPSAWQKNATQKTTGGKKSDAAQGHTEGRLLCGLDHICGIRMVNKIILSSHDEINSDLSYPIVPQRKQL